MDDECECRPRTTKAQKWRSTRYPRNTARAMGDVRRITTEGLSERHPTSEATAARKQEGD